MSTPLYPPPTSPDEVHIMDASVKLIKFLRRYLLWVIVFPLAGLSGGYFAYISTGASYEAQLMFRTRVLDERQLKFLADNYLKANLPGLDGKERGHIQSLAFEVTEATRVIKASKMDPYVLGVAKCIVDDPSILPHFAQAFKQHLENEPDVRILTKNYKELNTALADEYTQTIRKVQTLLEQHETNTGFNYKNPHNLPDLLEIYDKRQEVLILLRDSAAINVVLGFEPQPRGNEKIKLMMTGLAMGIGVLGIFLFLTYFAEYYRRYGTGS